MSAVEMIVTALAAGAGAGVTDTASAAFHDAYASLKDLIGRRLAGQGGSPPALDAAEVETGVWQAQMGEAIRRSGAADDEEIVAAAKRLLALADSAPATQSHIRVGTNYGAIGTFSAPVTFHQGPPVPPPGPAA